MDTLSDLGGRLRRWREDRGLSLAQAAVRSGLSKSAVAHWEAGRRIPPAAPLDALLDAYAVPESARSRLVALADPVGARLVLAGSAVGSPVPLGDVLRAMRLRRGLSQADLARRVDRSQAAVARWERGDDVPAPAILHALLFALNANEQEFAAIASLDPTTPREDDLDVRYHAACEVSHPLGETLWLGLEADLWWRAASGESHDELRQAVALHRADWVVFEARFDENLPLARRALTMGDSTPPNRGSAGAFGLAWASIRLGRNLETTVGFLADWESRVSDRAARTEIRSLRALVLAELDEASALDVASSALGMADDTRAHWFARVQLARIRLRHDDPEAVLTSLESEDDPNSLILRAQALAALGQAPPEGWIETIRAYAPNRVPLYRHRVASLERRLTRLGEVYASS